MRTAVWLVSAMTLASTLGAGCDNPEEHVATFASHRTVCSTWVGPSMCTVVIADDGDFNSLQRVEGLDWHWGETITFRYMQYHHDTSGQTDTFEHSYELIEVLSRVVDPVGTQYTLFVSSGSNTIVGTSGPNLRFEDVLHAPPPEQIECEPALCQEATNVERYADVVVELTDDPAVPLRIVAVTPRDL